MDPEKRGRRTLKEEEEEERRRMAAEEKPGLKSSSSIVPCFLFVEVSRRILWPLIGRGAVNVSNVHSTWSPKES